MEYFTLADDLEEIRSSKAKRIKRIPIVTAIIILFVSMRGLGLITIEYNKKYFHENHIIQKEILGSYGERFNEDDKHDDFEIDATDFNKHFGFQFGFFSAAGETDGKKYLEKLIKDNISKEKSIDKRFEFATVTVKKFEMSGPYWLPLIKNGKSLYRVFVDNKISDDTYSANFSGKIDFEVHGICTVDSLEKNIAGKIAKIVVDSIKNDYKK